MKTKFLKWFSNTFAFFLWTNNWYTNNNHFKFEKGDLLEFDDHVVGYGIDANVIILGYGHNELGGDVYITLHTTVNCDSIRHTGYEWSKHWGKNLPDCAEYRTKKVNHFKSNIELHGKKIKRLTPEELTFKILETNV